MCAALCSLHPLVDPHPTRASTIYQHDSSAQIVAALDSQVLPLQTPEFRTAVSIVSSPLTLLVSAWGMTSRKAVELLLGSGKARNSSSATPGAELQNGGDGSHK